jgi:RNA polymerase sigma-70 factor (ECF subfamily)
MSLSLLTFSDAERLHAAPEANPSLHMDQDTFRAIYESNARPLWVFLWRRTGDAQAADDLLQETFYRFLRARGAYASDAHRRNYLFRIATNLANDSYRRTRLDPVCQSGSDADMAAAGGPDIAVHNQRRADLQRALSRLPVKQRDALWLAYVEGSSHEEIAGILGMKVASIKLMLFRARRKMAVMLRGGRP